MPGSFSQGEAECECDNTETISTPLSPSHLTIKLLNHEVIDLEDEQADENVVALWRDPLSLAVLRQGG